MEWVRIVVKTIDLDQALGPEDLGDQDGGDEEDKDSELEFLNPEGSGSKDSGMEATAKDALRNVTKAGKGVINIGQQVVTLVTWIINTIIATVTGQQTVSHYSIMT